MKKMYQIEFYECREHKISKHFSCLSDELEYVNSKLMSEYGDQAKVELSWDLPVRDTRLNKDLPTLPTFHIKDTTVVIRGVQENNKLGRLYSLCIIAGDKKKHVMVKKELEDLLGAELITPDWAH